MARYGSRSYKRYYRRYPRNLRTSRIFSRTSAKSQAHQINALKRRINSVYRKCKPEIKSYTGDAETVNYTSSSTSSYYKIYPLVAPVGGTEGDDRIGDYINVINSKLYLSCEYFNNSDTGYHNSESAGCQVRLVVGQFKTAHQPLAIPAISELFEYSAGSGATYTQMGVVPLHAGITSKYHILKDYKFTLTSARNQAMKIITVKPKDIKWFIQTAENRNGLWVCILVSGLHYDSNFQETCKITFSNKIVYTDA